MKPADAAATRLALGNASRTPGRIRDAVAELDRLGALKSARSLLSAALGLAIAGDVPAATVLLERARSAPDWTESNPEQRTITEAVLAWRGGRLREAETTLRHLSQEGTANGQYVGTVLLGEVLLAEGRDVEGADALERARGMPWSATTDGRAWLDTHALLLLAQAYERNGQPARAKDRVDALLRIWDRADADLPGLKEARALRKRVAPPTAHATQR